MKPPTTVITSYSIHYTKLYETLPLLLRAPGTALAYRALEREEARLLGTRRSIPWAQAWWRPLHIAIAWAFVAGVAIHVVAVTFFAGYVANYGAIGWSYNFV